MILAEAGRKVMRHEIIDGMAYKVIGSRKTHSMTKDEAYKRLPEIWNHPDLPTMTAEQHEVLALELRQITLEHGIGGESEFRFLCETIRQKREKE